MTLEATLVAEEKLSKLAGRKTALRSIHHYNWSEL